MGKYDFFDFSADSEIFDFGYKKGGFHPPTYPEIMPKKKLGPVWVHIREQKFIARSIFRMDENMDIWSLERENIMLGD